MTDNTGGNTALRVSRSYGETVPVEQLHVADGVRTDTYFRPITPMERESFAEKVVQLSSTVEDTEEQKKAHTADFNAVIKDAKTERRELLRNLKRGTIEVADQIHVFYDHDNYRVHEYNSKGELVGTRRMRPEERSLIPYNQ